MRTGENIYKRKDGRYEARYKDGYKPNGDTKYRSIYGKTYTEVKARLEQVKTQTHKPIKIKNLIFNELYKIYMREIAYKVKISTLSTYEQLYYKHISPTLGGLRAARVNDEVINRLIRQKLSSGLSSKYVSDMVVLLLAIIRFGVRKNYLLPQPLDLMKFKVKKPKIVPLSKQEQSALESYLIESQSLSHSAMLLSLYTGIRLGEICALRVGDFELDTNTLHITKAMQRIRNPNRADKAKTIVIIGTPKSECSIRDIPIPPFLSERIKQQIKHYHKSSFFLTGELSHFMEPRLLEYHFAQTLKACCIAKKKFHLLRHTFATNAIRHRYFDIKSLSQILGHSSVKITYEKYIHSDMETQHSQMIRLNKDIISRINSGQVPG